MEFDGTSMPPEIQALAEKLDAATRVKGLHLTSFAAMAMRVEDEEAEPVVTNINATFRLGDLAWEDDRDDEAEVGHEIRKIGHEIQRSEIEEILAAMEDE